MNTATGSKASARRKDQNETTIKFILRSVNEHTIRITQNGREIIKVTEESRELAFNVATKELVRRFPIKRR